MIGGAFGYQDIDFDQYPEFSKSYLLRGKLESEVRLLFSHKVITWFENNKNLYVEGSGNRILYYRRRKRVKPEEIRDFMNEGMCQFSLGQIS